MVHVDTAGHPAWCGIGNSRSTVPDDNRYFFIHKDDRNGRLPILRPGVGMYERQYGDHAPPPGAAPFVFDNAYTDEFAARGIQEEIADILFDGATFIVRSHLRAQLMALALPHLYLHPAIYIDDQQRRHEDYWYVVLTHHFDCWDRQTSTYEEEGIEFDDGTLFSVYTYSLNTTLLNDTPLQERLLFRMGGTLDGFVTCHTSLAHLFAAPQSGAMLQAVTDY